MLENYYITGLPIEMNGTLGTIYQPSIKDMLSKGLTNVELVQPFLIHTGLYKELDDSKEEIKNFDLFYFNNIDIFIALINSLKVFYRANDEDISIKEHDIVIHNEVIINRDNFDDLADVILEMFMTQRPEREEEGNKYEDSTRQKLWEKIKKKREEASKKNSLGMCDIINVVCHVNGFVPYSQVLDLTYYQLINSYQMLITVDNYRDFIQYKVSTKFDVKQDTKHWLKDAKIKRSAIR